VLLKSKGYSDQKVADLVGVSLFGCRAWIRSFIKDGIDGIRPSLGRRGRKPIYTQEDHDKIFRKYVGENRQRLVNAKDEIEKEAGKKSSDRTKRRVLKKIAADGSAFD
jgi:transposase